MDLFAQGNSGNFQKRKKNNCWGYFLFSFLKQKP